MVSRKKLFISITSLCIILISFSPVFSQTPKGIQKDLQEIKERLIDLDKRLIKLEERVNSLDKRIDDLDNKLTKSIDHLSNLVYVILAGMFVLVGFVIWDRRTALAPAIRKNKELEEREEKLERALKEFATKNPEMKEILKNLGLL